MMKTEKANINKITSDGYSDTIVYGDGSKEADLMFIGEAPGAAEDEQGLPFVGRSGQLLTQIIEAMGFNRNEVFITNVVKQRPPNNRKPTDSEIEEHSLFLEREMEEVSPKVIVPLGRTAIDALLPELAEQPISSLMDSNIAFKNEHARIFPAYHPSYLLRRPSSKKIQWRQMKRVVGYLKNEN